MGEGQKTLWLERRTKERLRASAAGSHASVSQVAGELISEGLGRIDEVLEGLKREIFEEILIAVFGIEQMVFEGGSGLVSYVTVGPIVVLPWRSR